MLESASELAYILLENEITAGRNAVKKIISKGSLNYILLRMDFSAVLCGMRSHWV